MKIAPPAEIVIDYWITGRCDMACPFCYGADVPTVDRSGRFVYEQTPDAQIFTGNALPRSELSLEQTNSILLKLRSAGAKVLTITGGEPLLRKETPAIIRLAHEMGFIVYLSTNGTYFSRRYKEVVDYIAALGISLDGSTPTMNEKMGRSPYHFANSVSILRYFKQDRPRHLLKVGTVVSKINIDDISNIGNVLFKSEELQPPDVWRLYQFEPLKAGLTHKHFYEITDEEFRTTTEMVRSEFSDRTISTRSSSDGAYFFVTADGLLQTVGAAHQNLADLLTVDMSALSEIFEQNKRIVRNATKNREWLGLPD